MPEPMPSAPVSRMRRPPYETARGRRSRFWLVGLPMFAVFAAFGSIVWVAYVDSAPGTAVGEPPLIKADVSEIKLAPDDPGGRVVADQGEIRQLLADEEGPQRERLLPPPEQPLTGLGETEATGTDPAAPSEQAVQPTTGTTGATDGSGPATEGVVATAEPETSAPGTAATPSGQIQTSPAGPPSEATSQPAAGAPSQTTQDAEAALESLLAEVTEGQSAATPGSTTTTAPSGPSAGSSEPAATAPTRPAEPRQTAAAPASQSTDPLFGRPQTSRPAAAQREPVRPGEGQAATRPSGAGQGPSTVPVEPAPANTQQVAATSADYRIQLAAVRNEADARRAWDLFQLDLGDVLAGLDPIIERADTTNGVFYRVQVGPFASLGDAEALCDQLKRRNASCFVIRR